MHGVRETIGQRLRRLRHESGLSANAIGEAIRMNGNYVRQVERDEHLPGLTMAAELAKVYLVSLDYIAGLTEREQNPYVRSVL